MSCTFPSKPGEPWLNLAELEVKGAQHDQPGAPDPPGVVLIRISGGTSEILVRRPAGVAARAHLKGWASEFIFADQIFSDLGNNVWLQNSGFDPTASYYDIEVASSTSTVTITSGLGFERVSASKTFAYTFQV